ncbi:MAG: hypothetical protein B0D88_05245, partial [Candidatus Sedimenticola endophacoides]
MDHSPVHYRFSNIPGTISLRGGEDRFLNVASRILRDWRIERVEKTVHAPPLITLRHTPRGFLRNSRWLARERGYRHTVDACCDFIVDLLHAYLLDKPDLLSLHCGGVVFPQGLVLFPNTYRSGKSTLAIKLASMGLRIFSDDVIPYSRSERKGIALGILPR